MSTIEQQQNILKANVAVMLYDLLGRVLASKEINRAFIAYSRDVYIKV
jgi:hypothetical protein